MKSVFFANMTLLLAVSVVSPSIGQDPKPKEDPDAEKATDQAKDPFGSLKSRDEVIAEIQKRTQEAFDKRIGEETSQRNIAKYDTAEEALDALEAQIDEFERNSKYGNRQIRIIAEDLEAEYNQNSAELEGQDDPNAELLQRQRLILLQLSELKRIGPQLGRTGDVARIVNETLRPHRPELRNPELMRRSAQLMMRSRQASHPFYRSEPFSLLPPGMSIEMIRDPFGSLMIDPAQATETKELSDQELLARLKDPLKLLLRLRVADEDIVLDREHWSTPFAGTTLTAVSKSVASMLSEYGIDTSQSDRAKREQERMRHRSHVGLLLDNLQSYTVKLFANQGGSSGGGLHGIIEQRNFRQDRVQGSMEHSPTRFSFSLLVGDDLIRVVDSTNPRSPSLMITLLRGEHILRFTRKPDGSVNLVSAQGDETVVISGESFAHLNTKHRQVVEEKLLAVLADAGFVVPLDDGT